MIDALKFVQGAVAKTSSVPVFQHLRISNGRVTAYNSFIALSSPIDLDIEANPHAETFKRALTACDETAKFHVTKKGRLSVASGGFRALIECATDYPEIWPTGQRIPLEKGILETIRLLLPFVSENHQRPWANTIRFDGQTAYATNSIILAQVWLGYVFPLPIAIPLDACKEIVRIGEEPIALQVSGQALTLHYDGGRWLYAQAVLDEWPDIGRVLDSADETQPVPDGLLDAVIKISPFADEAGRVYLLDDKIATSADNEHGASVDVPGLIGGAIFNVDCLQTVLKIATSIDFSDEAQANLFFGDKLRGAIARMV